MQQIKFNDLSLPDKAIILAEYGKHMMSLDWHGYRIHLYSLNSHFVEVYFNVFTRQVEKIAIVIYGDLDKFTNSLSIRGLFK
jgi:hypothetical protein